MPLRKRAATSKHGYNSMGCLSIVTARYGWVGLGTGGLKFLVVESARRLGGHEGLKIMKRKASFTSLV